MIYAVYTRSLLRMSVTEAKIDEVEAALKKKIENKIGYGDEIAASRQLEQIFKFFDTDGSGYIDYDEFFAAMVRLNFVGVQRELEGLFDRYDENCDGTLDYKEFSSHLFGRGEHVRLEPSEKGVVERIKARILQRGGSNGVRTLTSMLKRIDRNGNHKLERDELKEGLAIFGIDVDDSPDGELDKIMAYFDVDGDGHISINEFIRGIRGSMNKARKMLVRQAFGLLDRTGDGIVTIEDLVMAYDATAHPEVINGKLTPEDAVKELLTVYEGKRGKADGVVTFLEFIEYYRDISAGIEDDNYFELMIRNAWHMSGGEGSAANSSNMRVLVTHKDGSQEVVEVKNDLGLRRNDMKKIEERLIQQGINNIAKVSLGD